MVLTAIPANTKTGNPQLFFQTFIPHLERSGMCVKPAGVIGVEDLAI